MIHDKQPSFIQIEIQGVDEYGTRIEDQDWILDVTDEYARALSSLSTGDEIHIVGHSQIPSYPATIQTRRAFLQFDTTEPNFQKMCVTLEVAYGTHMRTTP
jgi:hypothetical protein